MLVAALLRRFRVPVDLKDLFLDLLPRPVRDRDRVLLHHGNFAVRQDIRSPRAGDNRGNIGSDEIFAFSQPDDEGIILLRTNQPIGIPTGHKDQRVRSLDAAQHRPHRRLKITVVGFLQKMRQDFRIRLGLKYMALRQ